MDKTKIRRGGVERGVAAVELALLLIPLLLVVAGIVEFGRVFWYYDALAKATRDAARLMTTAPVATIDTNTTYGVPAAKELVLNAAFAANIPDLSTLETSVACDDDPCVHGMAPPEYVSVSISYGVVHIGTWMPFVSNGGWDVTIAPKTTMRYMR